MVKLSEPQRKALKAAGDATTIRFFRGIGRDLGGWSVQVPGQRIVRPGIPTMNRLLDLGLLEKVENQSAFAYSADFRVSAAGRKWLEENA